MHVCLRWHEAFNKMEYGGVPIIAALKGAVVGGGLELASAAHVRVIDPGTFFALPEGQRGIFTGGGATIRVSDMIGKYRMIDMILTGRVYQGQEAVDLGLAQYITEEGGSFAKAMELAEKVAQNLPLTNFAICSAVSHMNNMSGMDAAYAEAFVGGIVNTQPAARERRSLRQQDRGPRAAQQLSQAESGCARISRLFRRQPQTMCPCRRCPSCAAPKACTGNARR